MLITVGIPFFNGERTLARAIRSVFAQTHQDWELLLIDDGSTDGSLDLALSIRDPRVKVIYDGINRGVVHRHNQIADLARGELIAKLDDDDLMHPNRLHAQLQYFEANPDTDVVATSVYTIDDEDCVSGLKITTLSDLTPENVIARCVIIQPSTMGKAGWFRRNRYDPAYIRAEDHELWARTCAYAKFGIIEAPLTFYREGRSRTLRKYRLSVRSDSRIFLRHGAVLGWPRTARLIGASYTKLGIYSVLKMCNMQDLAFRRRRHNLDAASCKTAQDVLERTLLTPVRGLDPEKALHDVLNVAAPA